MEYKKLDQRNHILHRPDTYVGSVKHKSESVFISDFNDNFKIIKKKISNNTALCRIFIEILSNAIDNVSRSKKTSTPCRNIKVNIDKNTGETTIYNDGLSIPIELHQTEHVYIHTMLFGQLLTSSNYDDSKDRIDISGRNGYGATLTNIFSNKFQVEGADPNNKLYLKQIWNDNMKIENRVNIKKSNLKKGYTKISYIPDFKLFGINNYSDDLIKLFCRYTVEASMLTGIKVYFNDILIPVKNLLHYSKLYIKDNDKPISYIKDENYQLVITPTENINDNLTISFVNGIYTKLGGTHIDSVTKNVFKPLCNKLTNKTTKYSVQEIKKYFDVFISISVSNPVFDSQSKNKLESSFNMNSDQKLVTKISKWAIISDIKKSSQMNILKKAERKRKKFVKIDGLDSANKEGTKYSKNCTLILVEGLSAKTFAVQGIEVGALGKKGRDWFGIYALRGKLLNVRNSSTKAIGNNRVILDIIKALNLKRDIDYTIESNFNTLRYGKIMIITDQDVDGIHISGLIQNMIHFLFPTLLDRKESFIVSMQTPIVRILGKKPKLFYDENQYKNYMKEVKNKNIKKKYYKGLGTSTTRDIKETFGKKIIKFKKCDNTDKSMNLVFSKEMSNNRKEWLQNYNSECLLDWKTTTDETLDISMSNFLDKEIIKYSLNDCKRSIPHLMDGLKESQRKILYSCFLKPLNYSGQTLKVAQLSGFVAEKSEYHHGEQNLYDTITKLAQNYIGSNNIPLLYRDGQFGTRLHNGKDAANGRYIFTKLDKLTRNIFRIEDDVLLDYISEDDSKIEPYYYVPILPMVLVNGCNSGIGTGWSTNIPSFNPIDLIRCIKLWIKNRENPDVKRMLPNLDPWYNNYKGYLEKITSTKYKAYGTLITKDKYKVVTELPPGMSTESFKETLDSLRESKKINTFKNYSTPDEVNFQILENTGTDFCNVDKLKLYRYITLTNMVLFNSDNKITKYDNILDIIIEFCKIRYKYYVKRKNFLLDKYNYELKVLINKKRFLTDIMNEDIKLFKIYNGKRTSRSKSDLIDDLIKKKYYKIEKGFEYLLTLQFNFITEGKIIELINKINKIKKITHQLQNTTINQLWLNDLEEFEQNFI